MTMPSPCIEAAMRGDSKVGAELLFDVISTAYERTSLIVTTNLPFESWTEVLGSERLTGATLDRLTHRRRIIETKGESYRLTDAKARTRRTEPATSVDDAQTAQPPAPDVISIPQAAARLGVSKEGSVALIDRPARAGQPR
jgi:hypothetical protein